MILIQIPITTYAIPAPILRIYIQKYYWYYSQIPIITPLSSAHLQKSISTVLLVPFQTSIITYAVPAPILKTSCIQKVLLVLPLPIIACANQRPSSKFYIQKVLLVLIPNTNSNFAIQRLSSKIYPKSITGNTPKHQ